MGAARLSAGKEEDRTEKQPPPRSPGGRVGAGGVGGRARGAPGARARGGGVALHGGSVRLVVVGVGQLAAPSRAERARGS